MACGSPEPRLAADELQGTIELHERLLSFELPGRVVERFVNRGERVKQGQVIATLDDGLEQPQRALREADVKALEAQLSLLLRGARTEEVKGAEAQLRGAEAAEGTLKENEERVRGLLTSGYSTQAQLDDVQGSLKRATAEREAGEQRLLALRTGARPEEIRAARARAESARAGLKLVMERLARTRLVAPVEGVILDTHVEPGEVVGAGAAIATLGDPKRPFVDLYVPQLRAAAVKVGQQAWVRTDGSAAVVGRVTDVGRRTEFTPRYLYSPRERPNLVVRVRVELEDPAERLRAGVPAMARFEGRP